MKKIILSLAMIAMVSVVTVGATKAWLSDTETSFNNTFAAGSLNLTVDENDGTNTVKWTLSNLVPGNQPKGRFILENTGTIDGYLDLENIVVTSHENGIIEPETEAGDTTNTEGELEDVLNLRLVTDLNCDGWISVGDTTFFNGKVGTVASNYDLNVLIPAGGRVCVTGIYDWWLTVDDNKAMTDSFDLDITFELSQTDTQ